MSSIFYDGDLKSGINLALRDSKFVACFIKDDGEESSRWEGDYLSDAQVQSALSDRAITFRIEAGSEEAAFLTAYYPVPVVPALILLHNGVLALHLRLGHDKAAFKAGLMTALVADSLSSDRSSIRHEATVSTTSAVESSASSLSNSERSSAHSHTLRDPSLPIRSSEERTSDVPLIDPLNATQNLVAQRERVSNSASSSTNQQSVVQRLLEDRRRKLELDKQKKEEEEIADRRAKADARKKARHSAPDSAKAKQATYAQEQRKRNTDARLERERVLRQIELDKRDRKEREERHKVLMKADALGEIINGQDVIERQTERDGMVQAKDDVGKEAQRSTICAVQVRLFDGSTIRSKFGIDQTLTDVREWVDKERFDDSPFTFKQILSPLPNRSLTISEEKDTLIQLGFVPSVTLVMIPIRGYTAAYTDAPPTLISRISEIPFNTVTTGVGWLSGALNSFLGFAQGMRPQEYFPARTPTNLPSNHDYDSSESRFYVHTLHDREDGREDNQLYNGNQINVQPRNDDADKDK